MNNTVRIAASAGILLGVITISALSLNACSALKAAATLQQGQHVDTTIADTGDSKDVFTLSVGDCFDHPTDGIVTDVATVSCATPHDYEDYHQFRLTFASYPGEKGITDRADSVCSGSAFTSFDGVDYESSALSLTYLYPTAESWKAGDRRVDCIVTADSGQSTGSYRGTSR